MFRRFVMRVMIVLLFLLGMAPVRANECFDMTKVFSSVRSDRKATQRFNKLRMLLTEFFYIQGNMGPEIPSSMSWKQARELSRFLDINGIDVRVREDLFTKERETIFSAAVGAALFIGYTVGTYSSSKLQELLKKFLVSKKVQVGAGLMGGAGASF